MPKQKSRTARWADACAEARLQFEAVQSAGDALVEALNALYEVQAEYEEMNDNLTESLQETPFGQKLAELMNIDIESVKDEPLENWGEVERAIDEAEGADLPLGFGRD